MTKKEDAIKIRQSKVLDLISKGYSQAEIAKELRCSEPTISRDVQDMKDEATKSIKDHITNIPFQFERCITSYDMLLRRASSLLDSNGVDKLALIKLIADLQRTRLELHSAPVVLQKAIEYTKSLQAKVDALERERNKGAGYQIIPGIHQEAGKPDRIVRKPVRKTLQKQDNIIV